MGAVGRWLFGKKKKKEEIKQLPLYTPEQQEMMKLVRGYIEQEMARPDGLDFGPIRQRAMRDYTDYALPQLLGQYVGFGQSYENMPELRQLEDQGAHRLAETLAAQESQYNLSSEQIRKGLLSSMMGQYMQPAFQNYIKPEVPGQPGLAQQLLPLAAAAAGAYFAGPAGASMGYNLGSSMMGNQSNQPQQSMGGVYGR